MTKSDLIRVAVFEGKIFVKLCILTNGGFL